MELGLDHISKQFQEHKAVRDVSLTLTPGVWGLLGANGAGKTTLMRMIAGIIEPDQGTVSYDGVPVCKMDEKYREIFGYLPQEFGCYHAFTVIDYMEYVAALKGLSGPAGRRRIRELLERVSLADVYKKKISALSGGMKRRVGIAQALLNDPQVLVLDEPTSGLDPGERVRFRNLLSEFGQDRIVLISTHIVSDVEYIAQRIAIMKAGQLLAAGTTQELVESMQGNVFSCMVPVHAVTDYEQHLQIISIRREGREHAVIRYLAQKPCTADSVYEEPRLEDLFLWMFPQKYTGDMF